MRMTVLLCSKTIAQLCDLFSTSDNYIVRKTTAIMQNGDFTFTKIIWKYMIETPKTTLSCHVTAIYLLLDLQMTHFQLGRTQSGNDANSHICNVLYPSGNDDVGYVSPFTSVSLLLKSKFSEKQKWMVEKLLRDIHSSLLEKWFVMGFFLPWLVFFFPDNYLDNTGKGFHCKNWHYFKCAEDTCRKATSRPAIHLKYIIHSSTTVPSSQYLSQSLPLI